jgi:HEAT repeat protein
MKAARFSRRLGAAAAVLAAAACATPDSAKTPAQLLEESSSVLAEVGSYDARERARGIARFRALGKEQGTALILHVIEDPKYEDYRVEVVLARILADWKDPRAVPHLLPALRSLDEGAVQIASEGILALGEEPRVMAALGEMLDSPAVRERVTAARILYKLDSPQAVELLAERSRLEKEAEVRATCLLAVLNSRHARRREFLVEALADDDQAIRETAWSALEAEPGLPPVRFAVGGPPEERAAQLAAFRAWARRQTPGR